MDSPTNSGTGGAKFYDWDGVMMELFDLDNIHPLESPHDSSSGIASDGAANSSNYRSSTSLSTFRGTPSPLNRSSPRSTPSPFLHVDAMDGPEDIFTPSPHHANLGRHSDSRNDHMRQYNHRPDQRDQLVNGSPQNFPPSPQNQRSPHPGPIPIQDGLRRGESPHQRPDTMPTYRSQPSPHHNHQYAQARINGAHENGGALPPPLSYIAATHQSHVTTHAAQVHAQPPQYHNRPHPQYVQANNARGGHPSGVNSRQSPGMNQLMTDYFNQQQQYHEHVAPSMGAPMMMPNIDYDLEELPRRSRATWFDICPDDVVLRILANLSTDRLCRCSRVCRRWYSLVWEPALWTRIHIRKEKVDADKALRVLTRRLSYNTPYVCVTVEKINLNNCDKLTDKGLNLIAKRCPELRCLQLQGCVNITNMALFEVVSRCTNLEQLNVTGCSGITCISLTPEASMQAPSPYGKQILLRQLDMTDCYALEDAGLQIIASHCTQLQFLFLRRCSRITDLGIQYVAAFCSMLREFSISDCRRVTDFGMRELSKLESHLRYLSVAKCDKISDVGIKYIAKFCHKLRYLNARGCEAVSDESVELLAKNCSRLRSLDIGKCDITDEGLTVLGQYCPQLKKLSLKSCDAITDIGIIAIAKCCKHLQQLNIQDCHLTVEAYRSVKKQCKRCIIEHTNPGFY